MRHYTGAADEEVSTQETFVQEQGRGVVALEERWHNSGAARALGHQIRGEMYLHGATQEGGLPRVREIYSAGDSREGRRASQ